MVADNVSGAPKATAAFMVSRPLFFTSTFTDSGVVYMVSWLGSTAATTVSCFAVLSASLVFFAYFRWVV